MNVSYANSISKMFNLSNKTALITGAGSGIGARFSFALADGGAHVIIAGRDINKLEKIASEIRKKGGSALVIKLDISNHNSISQAIKELTSKGEKIDILVNNASISNSTPVFDLKNNDFDLVIQTNIIGTWNITKAIVNHMKEMKIEGSIINIASINGSSAPYEQITAYAASKAAIIHMTKSLVSELAKYKIRINTINPGPIQSHIYGASFEHDKSFWEPKIPLGFIGTPEDLDGALIYLASNNASRYVTGSCITIDGGISKE